jgi:hypothetical protein
VITDKRFAMNLSLYSWINESAKIPVLLVLIISAIILSVVLSSIGRSLKNEVAPQGIISFELAGSASRADIIVGSWSEAARQDAFLSLGLDYLFLCVYPLAISLPCHLAAARDRRSGLSRSRLGGYISWLVLAAIPLDGLENYALIGVLKSSGVEILPAIAKWCAIPKFGVVLLGIGYITAWLALRLAERVMRRAKAA